VNLISLRSGAHAVAGTLTGPRTEPRLVMMDDHTVEVPPAPHMAVVHNDDRPGMIGAVGTIIGEAQVSISSMAVGPSATGNTALMVLSTDERVPEDAVRRLRDTPGILDVHLVET
jgi:D-3-phosphoglycerate dehydrogenase / 2-oxoglutarate reductase